MIFNKNEFNVPAMHAYFTVSYRTRQRQRSRLNFWQTEPGPISVCGFRAKLLHSGMVHLHKDSNDLLA